MILKFFKLQNIIFMNPELLNLMILSVSSLTGEYGKIYPYLQKKKKMSTSKMYLFLIKNVFENFLSQNKILF